LGFWYSTVKGKVYFDNIQLVDLTDIEMVKKEDSRVYFWIKQEIADSLHSAALQRWIGNIDTAYASLQELTGYTPFNGAKIGFAPVRNYPGGLAVAGNPVLWMASYYHEEIANIGDGSNWSWVALHELGHNFDLDAWNFHGEFWTNFKMIYILGQNQAPLYNPNINQVVTGDQIKYYYYNQGNDSYQHTLAAIPRSLTNDGLTWCFSRIVDRIGWEPFKKMFRELAKEGPEYLGSKLAKFNRVLDLLQKYSNPNGSEVAETFPGDELDFIRTNIEQF
jgi:hypothetical protein